VSFALLSDVAEFFKHLKKMLESVPFETVAVVIVGLLATGGIVGWFARRLWVRSKGPNPVGPGPTTPLPPAPTTDHLKRLRTTLENNPDGIWNFHKPTVPHAEQTALHQSGCKVVVFLNQKGGVAKTTLAVNIAAHFASLGKRVLVVDLDYQGSATATLLRAAKLGIATVTPVNDMLLNDQPGHSIEKVMKLRVDGQQIDLLPSNDTLNGAETRALFLWLLTEAPKADVRTAMARAFASEAFRKQKYDVVVVDTPPRLTLGTINALTVATHYVIPTIPDGLSVGNIGNLVGQVNTLIKSELNPRLELAGIIATMTDSINLKEQEATQLEQAKQLARDGGITYPYVFKTPLPNKTSMSRLAGQGLAIHRSQSEAQGAQQQLQSIGAELADQIGVK
jgi:cellulose biosynthesis protein BcsQ